jgi:hypothetical protein
MVLFVLCTLVNPRMGIVAPRSSQTQNTISQIPLNRDGRLPTALIERICRRQCCRFLTSSSSLHDSTILFKSKEIKPPMFPRKIYKTRVETPSLPSELWLIIFDIVIENAIIMLNQCDYMTFPHVAPSLSASVHRQPFYDSYRQLRLVCRRFNTLLGARPWEIFSGSSLLPIPSTTRALYLDLYALHKTQGHFQRLLAETPTFRRLVFLDVYCHFSPSQFLRESAGPAFPNLQRLILRFVCWPRSPPMDSFWTLLHWAFPLLVTLALVTEFREIGDELPLAKDAEVVSFEWLEILYFSGTVRYSACLFPRLRHASIWRCSLPELEILIRSPHLESLLIRSAYIPRHNIDVTSCTRLKLLGFPDSPFIGLVPLGPDHPVEHIWIYSPDSSGNPELFKPLSRRLSKISRITVDFLSCNSAHHSRRIVQSRAIGLSSFGLTMRPLTMRSSGFPVLVMERIDAAVTESALKKLWGKIRQ